MKRCKEVEEKTERTFSQKAYKDFNSKVGKQMAYADNIKQVRKHNQINHILPEVQLGNSYTLIESFIGKYLHLLILLRFTETHFKRVNNLKRPRFWQNYNLGQSSFLFFAKIKGCCNYGRILSIGSMPYELDAFLSSFSLLSTQILNLTPFSPFLRCRNNIMDLCVESNIKPIKLVHKWEVHCNWVVCKHQIKKSYGKKHQVLR